MSIICKSLVVCSLRIIKPDKEKVSGHVITSKDSIKSFGYFISSEFIILTGFAFLLVLEQTQKNSR